MQHMYSGGTFTRIKPRLRRRARPVSYPTQCRPTHGANTPRAAKTKVFYELHHTVIVLVNVKPGTVIGSLCYPWTVSSCSAESSPEKVHLDFVIWDRLVIMISVLIQNLCIQKYYVMVCNFVFQLCILILSILKKDFVFVGFVWCETGCLFFLWCLIKYSKFVNPFKVSIK